MKGRIGLLTGGGDCPGLNAVIRAVTKTGIQEGYEIFGFLDGFSGLVENRYNKLTNKNISGLLHRGGTILGTNNRDNPFHYPINEKGEIRYIDASARAMRNMADLGITALVVVGGDGSLSIGRDLAKLGAAVVGVPKTIDNDLQGTDQTFGFATAVTTAAEALDRLHTTAESHHRVMVLEVMGRYAGWIALHSGVAGGADVILLPEIPWNFTAVAAKINERKQNGKPFSIVVVAEGAKKPDGEMVVRETVPTSADPLRLGGVGDVVATGVAKMTGLETRVTVLGHIQRGGSPVAYDRVLATRYGVAAVEAVKADDLGKVVCLQHNLIVPIPLEEVTKGIKNVDPDNPLVAAARHVGISFGDR